MKPYMGKAALAVFFCTECFSSDIYLVVGCMSLVLKFWLFA